jgi:phytoene dehydrogenase-like protein
MAHAAFLLNGRRRIRADDPVDPPLFLQRFPAQRAEQGHGRNKQPATDDEHEVLSIACPVRVSEVEHTPARINALRAQIIGRVRRVVPFLDDYLTDVSMPIDTQSWDADADSSATRRVNPWRLHPIYEAATRPFLGIAARPVGTYFKNLVHCGQDVVPGLGLEGEYIAGTRAALRLQEMAGRAWRK